MPGAAAGQGPGSNWGVVGRVAYWGGGGQGGRWQGLEKGVRLSSFGKVTRMQKWELTATAGDRRANGGVLQLS